MILGEKDLIIVGKTDVNHLLRRVKAEELGDGDVHWLKEAIQATREKSIRGTCRSRLGEVGIDDVLDFIDVLLSIDLVGNKRMTI